MYFIFTGVFNGWFSEMMTLGYVWFVSVSNCI